jgi:exodeoxyribonuclease VII large subunit
MAPASENSVLSVGQLNNQIRDALQVAFRSVWVAGEITDLSRPGSGHLYFSLKDASGAIKAVAWRNSVQRLRFEPEDGMQVLCCGDIDVYPPRGTYQLIVRQMQVQGEGELQAALRKLREKLEAEGLFDQARKRPLPRYPRRIAVVTSASGAALRDFLEVVRRRWSDLELLIVPTRVQGMDVGPEIARAIAQATKVRDLDAILVTRGGGSLEDLWGFNDELVVRAIHDSPVPVVSAVGHEIDVTLSDLVADVRALTPSEAGELLVPDADEWSQRLGTAATRMRTLLRARFDHAHARLQAMTESRVLRNPYVELRDRERMLDDLQQRATRAVGHRVDNATNLISNFAAQLETLSPLKVLSRGYAITQKLDGQVVKSTEQLEVDEEVLVRLSNGQLSAIVRQLREEEN